MEFKKIRGHWQKNPFSIQLIRAKRTTDRRRGTPLFYDPSMGGKINIVSSTIKGVSVVSRVDSALIKRIVSSTRGNNIFSVLLQQGDWGLDRRKRNIQNRGEINLFFFKYSILPFVVAAALTKDAQRCCCCSATSTSTLLQQPRQWTQRKSGSEECRRVSLPPPLPPPLPIHQQRTQERQDVAENEQIY